MRYSKRLILTGASMIIASPMWAPPVMAVPTDVGGTRIPDRAAGDQVPTAGHAAEAENKVPAAANATETVNNVPVASDALESNQHSTSSMGEDESKQPTASPGKTAATRHRVREFLHPPPALVPFGLEYEDVVRRPFLYWREWINQTLPWNRVLYVYFCATTALQIFFGKTLVNAKEYYERKWLRNLGVGLLFGIIGMTLVGSMARMGLYAPLATVLLAAIQFVSLMGLTIAASTIGGAVLRVTRIDQRLKRPWLQNFIPLWMGIFILSFLVLIPGFGMLPRLGNRLLSLIAAAGTGAFLSYWQVRQRGDDEN